jgi:hypothetical protein
MYKCNVCTLHKKRVQYSPVIQSCTDLSEELLLKSMYNYTLLPMQQMQPD